MSQTKAELVNGLNINAALADAVTVDSSGRLLLGTTTEGHTSADDLTVANSGSGGITIRSGTSNDGNLWFSDGTSGDAEYRGYVQYEHANDKFNFGTAATTRLTIDSSGNFGIGTSSPTDYDNAADNLVVKGTGNTGITVATTNTASNTSLVFSDGTGNADDKFRGAVQYIHNGDVMRFLTSATERMRLRTSTCGLMINDDGSTRIGEPMLHVLNGGSGNNVASFFFNTTDDRDVVIIRHNGASGGTSRGMINILNSAGNGVGHIHGTGSTVTYNSVSDYRLKENVVAISDGITRLKTLKPSRFNFIADAETTVDGFLAHEVTAVPEAITGTKDAVDSDNNPIYQAIDQSKLVPLLTAALQEAVAKIEVLETKVAALEAA